MSASRQECSVVATYNSHANAEQAVRSLEQCGLDMRRLSIIAKDVHTEEHVLGFYTAGDRIQVWGRRGAFWGSLTGILFGGAVFFIPAIGPLIVLGPLAGWILGALEGAAVGGAAGAIGAALAGIGIPNDSIIKYELEVKAGKYLVLARGTDEMIKHARALLETSGATLLTAHAAHPIPPARNGANGVALRRRIFDLLSDEEISRVSTAEASGGLAAGTEYLDLEQLDRGVMRASEAAAPGQLLARSSVSGSTWQRILSQLPVPRSLEAHRRN